MALRGDTAMIDPAEGAYAFRKLLTYDRPYTGYTPFEGSPWLDDLAERSPFAESFRVAADGEAKTGDLLLQLQSLPVDERPDRLRKVVAERVTQILRRRIDPDHAFGDHGLDSLGSLELRTQIERHIGIRMSPKAIAVHNTVRTLAAHISDCLAGDSAA